MGLTKLYPQSLSGYVFSEGEPVPGAHIILNNGDYSTFSDNTGYFAFNDLSQTEFQLKVTSVGFFDFTKKVSLSASSSLRIDLEPKMYFSDAAVVTATRTTQQLEDIPIPVSVINQNEIQSSGATTLTDLLLEQPGIALSPDEGNSIQMQDFESDYTLILLNGQPLIGRTRGALDLSRINLADVKQIEIVKGPSSALWGSDALAGVINIISSQPTEPFSMSAYSEYGSRNSYDLGGNIGLNRNKLSAQFGFSFDGSDGFDIDDSQFGNNQNPYDSYGLNSTLSYNLSPETKLRFQGRYARTDFSGSTIATLLSQVIPVEENGWQKDLSSHFTVEVAPLSGFKSLVALYNTRFEDYALTVFQDPTVDRIINNNKQGLDKLEIQNTYSWSNHHISTFGGGLTGEFVQAPRFQGKRTQSGNFLFLQHQLFLGDDLNIIGGLRLDNHSSYESYLSPKLSAQYNLSEMFSIRASYGKGFKAPDFRTLYLDFENAGTGYSIYGSQNIAQRLELFQDQGLLIGTFINQESISLLEPEFSTAINFGFDFKPTSSSRTRVNIFQNNARNLIESLVVAELTNGTDIYGYANINKARTRGIETEQDIRFSQYLRIGLGYQYLEAVQIESEGRTIIDNGQVIEKEVEVERPLSKRPEHSGTAKLFLKEKNTGIEASVRGVLRSSFFFADRNANKKADRDSNEFAPRHSIWNISLRKELNEYLLFQVGADNIFNHTDPDFLQYQPGTTFYTKLFLTIK